MAKILIVEDDRNLTSIVEALLTHERHTVEIVHLCSDAQAVLRVYKYDALVLDLMLPDGSGLDILRDFRSRGGKTPVLILTGQETVEEKEAGFDTGADDYLTKPFEPRELLARVRALLRRPAPYMGTQLTVGNLVLDPSTLSVKISSADIALRPKEFAVLEFLMRHPNHVFSAEDLLARVWGSEAESSQETVRVTIKRLREKLGDSSPVDTIRGAGYILRTS